MYDWLETPNESDSNLTKLDISYRAEEFKFPDWQDGDKDGITVVADASSTTTFALDGALASNNKVDFGAASRQIEIIRTGGSNGPKKFKITGKLDDDWNPMTPLKDGFRELTLDNNGQMMTDVRFSSISKIEVVGGSADGQIEIGTPGGMVDTPNYRVHYTGTNFDDVIRYDNDTSFLSMVKTTFGLNKVTEMGFTGGLGDDIIYGANKTNEGR